MIMFARISTTIVAKASEVILKWPSEGRKSTAKASIKFSTDGAQEIEILGTPFIVDATGSIRRTGTNEPLLRPQENLKPFLSHTKFSHQFQERLRCEYSGKIENYLPEFGGRFKQICVQDGRDCIAFLVPNQIPEEEGEVVEGNWLLSEDMYSLGEDEQAHVLAYIIGDFLSRRRRMN
ncbi:hypothetical protein MVEN_01016000 [Mycena venus]|uniref:Uncharacterized protein n=1 Tax=Mycena venus TaxID=2733690 RepID=A0A8H6YCV2_9AGAR|nr:hypothetical protein MVEN_01016000 [Mycena venus]